MIAKTKVLSKKELAKKQGISRSSLYYQLKMPIKDWHLKNRIETVLKENPSYGYRRIALALNVNRKIVGWCLLNSHAVQLTLTALMNAIEKYGRPEILHSDQGSEYKSKIYASFAESLGIRLSMSKKASPWENGYQESFYSQFKVDLGDQNRFKTLGELAVAIYLQIYYYNNQRIHTKLKMPPALFAERLRQPADLTTNYVSIKV